MLDRHDRGSLRGLLQRLECRVVLPEGWTDFFDRRGPQPPSLATNRRWNRMFYRTQTIIELETTLPAIPRPSAQHIVLMRDISRSGAGFLHAEQLYPGEALHLWLETGARPTIVSRCVRHNANCFEIGVEFAGANPPMTGK